MIRYSVILTIEASDDLAAAFEWYGRDTPARGEDFRRSVLDQLDRITELALVHPPDETNIRRRRVPGYPYSIAYEVEARIVTVFAVAHHKRAPEYWRSR